MGSDESKKIHQEDLNRIVLHIVPHEWDNHAMMLRFDFESYYFQYYL